MCYIFEGYYVCQIGVSESQKFRNSEIQKVRNSRSLTIFLRKIQKLSAGSGTHETQLLECIPERQKARKSERQKFRRSESKKVRNQNVRKSLILKLETTTFSTFLTFNS